MTRTKAGTPSSHARKYLPMRISSCVAGTAAGIVSAAALATRRKRHARGFKSPGGDPEPWKSREPEKETLSPAADAELIVNANDGDRGNAIRRFERSAGQARMRVMAFSGQAATHKPQA